MPFPRISSYPLTIVNGAAVTGAADTQQQPIAGIRMPAAWTAADISIEESPDGTNWYPLYIDGGDIRRVQVAASYPGAHTIILSPIEITCARYVRLRSINVASSADVNQGAERALTLIAKDA